MVEARFMMRRKRIKKLPSLEVCHSGTALSKNVRLRIACVAQIVPAEVARIHRILGHAIERVAQRTCVRAIACCSGTPLRDSGGAADREIDVVAVVVAPLRPLSPVVPFQQQLFAATFM